MKEAGNNLEIYDPTRIFEEYSEDGYPVASVESTVDGNTILVKAVGEMDIITAPVLNNVILEQQRRYPDATQIDMDATRANTFDAVFLGVVTRRMQAARLAGSRHNVEGKMTIRLCREEDAEIFRITHLDQSFEIVIEEASNN